MRTSLLPCSGLLLLVLVGLGTPVSEAADAVRPATRHDLTVVLVPQTHELAVTDRVSFAGSSEAVAPDAVAPDVVAPDPEGRRRFLLHSGLDVAAGDDHWVVEGPHELTEHERRRSYGLPVRAWTLRPADGTWAEGAEAVLRYEGRIHHPPQSEGEEYARSFARTPGTISAEGVVLTKASFWVPDFGEATLAFSLDVALPDGWEAVSQGDRVSHGTSETGSRVVWECTHPMEEVYLIANRWTVFERQAGPATAYAFLREPDSNLAGRYLEATAQYLAMYQRLIGPYPFGKFALVENFWETGYGMPSFTLLGPRVIRMPFILHSSYPHEILHNWWGNSVYVDWETGNWCEGVTAYLADHLVREGQGRGEEYRFDVLKKFRSYVQAGRDFPLVEFRSRRSGATEAVGYGKCLMLFHMLRRRFGDEVFAKALQRFYRDHLWRSASFADVEQAFALETGEELGPFFHQWVARTGAPALAVTARPGGQNDVIITVTQTQEADPYRLTVPVAITMEGREEALVVPVDLEERTREIAIPLPGRPIRVDLDPSYDVFRRLDLAETPPTFSELFGSPAVTLVVPAPGSDPLASAWRTLAETWTRTGAGQVQIVQDDALEALPSDRAVWILGSGNRWRTSLEEGLAARGARVTEDGLEFGETRTPRAGHGFVFTVRHPGNPELALGWVGTDVPASVPGLARKLPHYGRYSYLAFTGDAPDNVVKGRWSALDSPLTVVLAQDADGTPPPRGALPSRQALARLAPVFDARRLLDHVRYLADDRMEGRGVGTEGLEKSAEYVAAAFKAAGLEPGGDDGGWFQSFEVADGPDGEPVTLRNVVGVLPGTKETMARQSVVIGAHYDHLGKGWPDVRSGNEGRIHNGADDNASGIAVLLELARVLGRTLKPERSVVFAAFSGEEWGRKGSKHYVEETTRWPAREAIAMLNLDTVGRLGSAKLQVLGAGTAREWRHIAMGVGYTTGVESNCIAEDPEGSDQVSFQEAGVPAVQLFTGAHGDYHRPTDDLEKIDAEGMVKVATFAREALVYLSQRPEPLTSTLGTSTPRATVPGAPSSRRVSLGTVPAFDHTGPGVKVASVVEGSAAAEAGLEEGDLLLAVDGVVLESLRHYSDVLKQHAPGDVVTLRVKRLDETLELEATLRAR